MGCGMISLGIARGQTVNVPGGLPQSVHATYPELGMGGWTAPTATSTQSLSGTGAVVSTTPTSSLSGADPLETMDGQSWGYAASQNATALGVNPQALAATCIVESGCQNLSTATGTSSITGAFQMTNATYEQELQKALAANPSLAAEVTDTSTAGQSDPATQAIAAAQYLKDAATTLENSGVANPSAVDARGYYNFGPQAGVELATADSTTAMSTVLTNMTASQLSANGITAGETVGQWKASVAAKMGSGANASILVG